MIKVVCDFCGENITTKNIKKINQNNLDICDNCIKKLKEINKNKDDVVFEIILADICNIAAGFKKRKSKLVNKKYKNNVIEEFKKEHKAMGDWRTSIIVNKYIFIEQNEICLN